MRHPRFINKAFTRADNEVFETYRPELVERGWWELTVTTSSNRSPTQPSTLSHVMLTQAPPPSQEGSSPSLRCAPHPPHTGTAPSPCHTPAHFVHIPTAEHVYAPSFTHMHTSVSTPALTVHPFSKFMHACSHVHTHSHTHSQLRMPCVSEKGALG